MRMLPALESDIAQGHDRLERSRDEQEGHSRPPICPLEIAGSESMLSGRVPQVVRLRQSVSGDSIGSRRFAIVPREVQAQAAHAMERGLEEPAVHRVDLPVGDNPEQHQHHAGDERGVPTKRGLPAPLLPRAGRRRVRAARFFPHDQEAVQPPSTAWMEPVT